MPYVCWVAIPTSQNMNQVKIIKLFQTRLSERQRSQHVLGKESEFPFYYWGGGGQYKSTLDKSTLYKSLPPLFNRELVISNM